MLRVRVRRSLSARMTLFLGSVRLRIQLVPLLYNANVQLSGPASHATLRPLLNDQRFVRLAFVPVAMRCNAAETFVQAFVSHSSPPMPSATTPKPLGLWPLYRHSRLQRAALEDPHRGRDAVVPPMRLDSKPARR